MHLIALFAILGSPAPAATKAPATTTVGTIDALASTVTSTQFQTLMKGIYSVLHDSAKILEITKPQSEMPPDDPFVHYAGVDSTGRTLIWRLADINVIRTAPRDTYETVLAAAAADTGAAGSDWKTLFDRLGTIGFEHLAGRVFVSRSEAERTKSANDIAFAKKIHAGTARHTVYAMLKQRGLIAYNNAYNPGRPIPGPSLKGGCTFALSQKEAYWPYFNEPVPERHAVCAAAGKPAFVKNPDAYIGFSMGFDSACRFTQMLTLRFDLQDKLTSIKESAVRTLCV